MPDLRPTHWEVTLKITNRLRARGPAEVFELALDRLRNLVASEDVLTFFAGPLGPNGDERLSGSAELEVRPATAEDGPRYARDVGTDSARSFRARLSPDTRCFIVEREEVIVHASWVTTTAAWTRELGRYFCPPSGDAYIYESYTRPEVRGQGIYPLALKEIVARLAREGVARLWVGVEASNPPSMKSVTKAGFEPGFEISFRRRFGRLSLSAPTGPLADECRRCLEC